jgi:hypothetical protein
MSAVWFRFRADLRGRWRSVVALAFLVGVAGGAALAAVAGARRTDTAYSRLVDATDAWDVLVNPDLGSQSALRSASVAKLPMVESAGRLTGLAVVPHDLESPDDFDRYGIVLASDGHAGYAIGRPKILEGRMPDPGAADEVLVNQILARQEHLHVGSRMPATVVGRAGFDRLSDPSATFADAQVASRRGELGDAPTLRVAGIGVVPDEIVVDEGFADPQMILTPAFSRQHPDAAPQFWGEIVRLRGGAADVPAFRRAVEALVPDEAVAFQTSAVNESKVDRAVQPSVGALTIFAIVIGLTGLLVVGQAIARQGFLDSAEYPALHALGFERSQLFGSAMLRAVLVAAGGGVIAVALAVAVSPLTPIGPARLAEPAPGVRIDPMVLGSGAAAVFVLVLLLSAIPAYRYARTRAVERDGTETTRPSRLAGALSGAGAAVPMVTGVRMALEPGRGRTAAPVRTTIVGAMLALAAVTGAVVFAASLDHLVSTPRLYGWNWDVRVDAAGDTAQQAAASRRALAALLRSSPAVKAWSKVSMSNVTLNGTPIPAVGIDPGGRRVGASVVSGRAPRRTDEIALGARTQRSLGVAIGDTVRARLDGGGTTRLRVIGQVVLPGFGVYSGQDKTTLGEGALVTRAALARLGPRFPDEPFLVDFRPGADRQPVLDGVAKIADAASGAPSSVVVSLQRPSDIIAYERVRTTPLALAAVLALLALATVTHALVTATRRRRRDVALLKTLGFTRRQVLAAVAWQATTIGVAALVVGLPLGVVLGRWAWTSLADNLGTVSEPIVPLVALLVAVPVVLLVVNAAAFAPGRIAARLRPATVLRSE